MPLIGLLRGLFRLPFPTAAQCLIQAHVVRCELRVRACHAVLRREQRALRVEHRLEIDNATLVLRIGEQGGVGSSIGRLAPPCSARQGPSATPISAVYLLDWPLPALPRIRESLGSRLRLSSMPCLSALRLRRRVGPQVPEISLASLY